MPELTVGRDCLALYKTHPAIVLRVGDVYKRQAARGPSCDLG